MAKPPPAESYWMIVAELNNSNSVLMSRAGECWECKNTEEVLYGQIYSRDFLAGLGVEFTNRVEDTNMCNNIVLHFFEEVPLTEENYNLLFGMKEKRRQ